jgi:hypothetical protein
MLCSRRYPIASQIMLQVSLPTLAFSNSHRRRLECKNGDADFGTRKLAREVFVARSIRSKIHFKL